jgi:Holliday junction resolvase
MNSRDKGKRGEREWAEYLTQMGFPARRGQQFKGGPDSPDVICDSLPRWHWEVKRTERLQIYKAMAQAEEERPKDATSAVAHRNNRGEWLVVLRAADFLRLLAEVQRV